jgi:hypothetical protein
MRRRATENVGMMLSIALLCLAVASGQITESNIQVRGSADWEAIAKSSKFVNQDPDPAEPGGYVDLRFKVENIGTETTNNVVFEVLPIFPFSIDPGNTGIVTLGSIDARQVGENAYVIRYKLRIDRNAVQGDNEVRVRYSLDNGQSWRTLDPFTVRIKSGEAIVSIESVTTNPGSVEPGQAMDLDLGLRSMADSYVKNVRVSLMLVKTLQTATSVSFEELPFSPVGSTNEKTIRNIGAGELMDITFRLVADPGATAGVYKIPVTLSYSDALGKNYTKNSLVSITVDEKPDYAVSVDSSTAQTVGSRGKVGIKFVNKGNNDIKFLYMQLKPSDAYDIISSDKVYLGKIDSDDYATAEFDLYLKKDANGKIVLPVSMEFRDTNNQRFTDDLSLDLRVYKGEDVERLGITKKSNTIGILIVVGIVVVGLVVYRFVRKKKK